MDRCKKGRRSQRLPPYIFYSLLKFNNVNTAHVIGHLTSSVLASQSMMFTKTAAPPSIQQAALRGPFLEKADTETTMDVVCNVLAISLTVSRAPFLISAILVPCGVFLGCSSLLMSRAIATITVAPYQSAALLATMLPFASRKDVLLAMLIAALARAAPLAAIAIDSAAIIVAPAAVAQRHHYLLAATAIGLCASTDYELQMLLLLSYCALRAAAIFRRVVKK